MLWCKLENAPFTTRLLTTCCEWLNRNTPPVLLPSVICVFLSYVCSGDILHSFFLFSIFNFVLLTIFLFIYFVHFRGSKYSSRFDELDSVCCCCCFFFFFFFFFFGGQTDHQNFKLNLRCVRVYASFWWAEYTTWHTDLLTRPSRKKSTAVVKGREISACAFWFWFSQIRWKNSSKFMKFKTTFEKNMSCRKEWTSVCKFPFYVRATQTSTRLVSLHHKGCSCLESNSCRHSNTFVDGKSDKCRLTVSESNSSHICLFCCDSGRLGTHVTWTMSVQQFAWTTRGCFLRVPDIWQLKKKKKRRSSPNYKHQQKYFCKCFQICSVITCQKSLVLLSS